MFDRLGRFTVLLVMVVVLNGCGVFDNGKREPDRPTNVVHLLEYYDAYERDGDVTGVDGYVCAHSTSSMVILIGSNSNCNGPKLSVVYRGAPPNVKGELLTIKAYDFISIDNVVAEYNSYYVVPINSGNAEARNKANGTK